MESKIKVTLYLSTEINDKLRTVAYATGKAKGVIVDELLELFFERFEKNAKRRGILLFGN